MSSNTSGHWYDAQGNAMHEVPSANGEKMVKTTVIQARRLGLFPSVTTILKEKSKHMLEQWKMNQIAIAAYNNPVFNAEDEHHYVKRIQDLAFKQVDQAAEAGTAIHAAAENYMQGLAWNRVEQVFLPGPAAYFPMWTFIDPLAEFMATHSIWGTGFEQHVVNTEYGFAGCADLPFSCPRGVGVLDYKTRKTKPGKPVVGYDEQLLQIAAYSGTIHRERLELSQDVIGCNLFISTTEPGRIDAIWYDPEQVKGAYHGFGHLVKFWQFVKNYNPTDIFNV